MNSQMRTAVVTGGSKGIGFAIVQRLLKSDYRVVVLSRTAGQLNEVQSPHVKHLVGDVQERESHRSAVKAAMEWGDHLDLYANCAGVSIWRPIQEVDESFLTMVLSTNVHSAFWGSQAAAAVMKEGSSIVNISSLAGKRGSANNSVYCASKFALNGLTQSLAKELGSKGIRVNAVCPAYVPTESIMSQLKNPISPAGGKPVASYLAEFAQGNAALGRLPTACEVADAVYFLASSEAGAITGQCVNVDCGVMPQ